MESNSFSIGAKDPYATLQDPVPGPVLGISAPHANPRALDRQTAGKYLIQQGNQPLHGLHIKTYIFKKLNTIEMFWDDVMVTRARCYSKTYDTITNTSTLKMMQIPIEHFM